MTERIEPRFTGAADHGLRVDPGLRYPAMPGATRPPMPAASYVDHPEIDPVAHDDAMSYGAARYRRGADRLRRRRAHSLRRLVMPSLLLSAAVIGFIGWHSGFIERASDSVASFLYAQSGKAGLVVQNIVVSGLNQLKEDELREVVATPIGTPIFAVDPDELRERIASIGWVKSATVARELPNTITITIEERKPVALWQRQGTLSLIDESGHSITSLDLDAWLHLPQVVGKGAERAAASLIPMLASDPDLAKFMKAAVRVGERRWDIVFENGIRARLPEQDAWKAWQKLGELEREHHMLAREINVIDLRQPDRLVLRLTNEEIARRKAEEEAKAKAAKGGAI